MHGHVLPQAWREVEIRSQDEWNFRSLVRKTHVLHQIGVGIAAENDGVLDISCKQQNLPTDENQRERTNADALALVPLFAMLIAAQPVPAHEKFFASLAAVTGFSLSKWVSEMGAASKSDVRM